MFYALIFGVLALVKLWRGVLKLLGRRPSKEVLAGTHVPLYDRAWGVCELLAGLGFGLVSGGHYCKNVLDMPVPGWLFGVLLGLVVVMILLPLVAETVFREENFH